MFEFARDLVVALVLCGVAGVTGWRIVNALLHNDPPAAPRWVIIALGGVLGMGVLGYAVFLFAVVDVLNSLTIMGVGIVFTVAGVRALITAGCNLGPRLKTLTTQANRHQLTALCVILTATTIIVVLLFVRVPSIFYDALVYHFAVPAQYLRAGGLVEIPWVVHSYFPFLSEMWITAGMALGAHYDALPRLLLASALPLAAACAGALAIELRRDHPRTQHTVVWTVTVLFLSARGVMEAMVFPLADGVFALFHLATVLCLFTACRGGGIAYRWTALAGICAGFAMSTKYTGLLYGPLAGGIILTAAPRDAGLRERVRALVLFLAIMGMVAAPWYVRNLLWTGNPVYPAMHSVFGGAGWSAEQQALLDVAAHHVPVTLFSLLRIPFELTFAPDFYGIGAAISPVLLVGGLAYPFIRRMNRREIVMYAYAIAFFLVWAFTYQKGRFALALMGVGAVCAGESCLLLLERVRSGIFIVAALLFGATLWGWHDFSTNQERFNTHAAAKGVQSPDEYLHAMDSSYRACTFINESLDTQVRILFVGETRTYFCKRDAYAPTMMNRHPLSRRWDDREHLNTVRIASVLDRLAITHVLYGSSELKRLENSWRPFQWTRYDKAVWEQYLAQHATLLWSDNRTELYAVRE